VDAFAAVVVSKDASSTRCSHVTQPTLTSVTVPPTQVAHAATLPAAATAAGLAEATSTKRSVTSMVMAACRAASVEV
jgi:hypothetical protein